MNRRTKPSPAQTGYKWVGWEVWDWTLFEEIIYKLYMEFQSWSKCPICGTRKLEYFSHIHDTLLVREPLPSETVIKRSKQRMINIPLQVSIGGSPIFSLYIHSLLVCRQCAPLCLNKKILQPICLFAESFFVHSFTARITTIRMGAHFSRYKHVPWLAEDLGSIAGHANTSTLF